MRVKVDSIVVEGRSLKCDTVLQNMFKVAEKFNQSQYIIFTWDLLLSLQGMWTGKVTGATLIRIIYMSRVKS